MPSPEYADLYQRAVLWPFAGRDGFGQEIVGPPVEIAVRWLTGRVERLQADGTTITYDASARTGSQQVTVGSRMWLGTLLNWSENPYGTGTGVGGVEEEVMYVKDYHETPDIKNRFAYRIVYLMRLKNV
jgi:hypothetical protein